MPFYALPLAAAPEYCDRMTASVRFLACSFCMIREIWDLTVFCDRLSSLAITLFDMPRSKVPSTCRSRSVRLAAALLVRAGNALIAPLMLAGACIMAEDSDEGCGQSLTSIVMT